MLLVPLNDWPLRMTRVYASILKKPRIGGAAGAASPAAHAEQPDLVRAEPKLAARRNRSNLGCQIELPGMGGMWWGTWWGRSNLRLTTKRLSKLVLLKTMPRTSKATRSWPVFLVI